ncbi:MAG TPA: hypothetical protein EYQ54_07500 [Myxococcales bacterium]|nr:hypothetical protein [Myxococcales bacterium]
MTERGFEAMRFPFLRIHWILVLFIFGCETFTRPHPDLAGLRARAETQAREEVEISATLLTREDARRDFSSDLVEKGVQPIWLEIRNGQDQEFVVQLLSIDRDYFSPSEVAWKTRALGEGRLDERMLYFLEQHLPVVVPPKSSISGFVYANFHPGAKAFRVELIGERDSVHAQFVVPVEGFRADFMRVEGRAHDAENVPRDLDLPGLRAYMEELPCCVLGGDRKTAGDPLNLVVVGTAKQIVATFVTRGWDLTETMRGGTVLRTVFSSVFGSRYRTSPVSPLYVFDRPQDAALQKARKTVDERNHLRLWLAPVTVEGNSVWVGQISRDVGVKLSSKTLITHKIDPVVDEARLYVTLDLAASGYLGRYGYVRGVGSATPQAPRYNYTLDPYFTDGLRVVLFLSDELRGYNDIESLGWEALPAPGE